MPLTRRAWIAANWAFESGDKIEALVAGIGDAEELAEIPRFLSEEDPDAAPAKIIAIR
jgi:hypothetical protein